MIIVVVVLHYAVGISRKTSPYFVQSVLLTLTFIADAFSIKYRGNVCAMCAFFLRCFLVFFKLLTF